MRIHVLIIVLFLTFFSCDSQSIRSIEPSEFKAKIESTEVQLLDVRTVKEFTAGHIPNALQIDVKEADFLSLAEKKIAKDKPIYIYCRSGARSTKATKILQAKGFTEIYNLEGGILNWKAKNYKTNK